VARVVNIGQSGTGKSYYAGFLLEQVVPSFDLAVHFDIEDEERGLSDANHDPLYKTLRVDKQKAEALSWPKVLYNHRKVRVVPEDLTTDEMTQLYATICGAVMKLCRSVVPDWTAFVSCDEAHNIITQASFPQPVERMITGGRKHGVECMHITQRPQLLHTTVISQADRRVYFRVTDNNDLAKIDGMSTFPAERLESLPDRVCIVENKSNAEHKRVETDGVDRQRPHYSGDDGVVDEHLPV